MSFWKNEKDSKETNNSAVNSNTKSARPAESNPSIFDKPNVTASPSTSSASAADTSNPAQRYSNIRSALGPGTIIQGKLSFDTPVRIDGKLSGEVFSSEALIIGSSGSIDATLKVASLVIMGKVKGTIIATDRIELLAGGSLEGEVTTPALKMDEQSFFNGKCTMGARAETTTLASKDAMPKPAAKVAAESPKRDEAVKPEVTQPEAGMH